ncbi:MAG: metal ABC transporter substrate-binding protein [Dehalococcoidia bacterium]
MKIFNLLKKFSVIFLAITLIGCGLGEESSSEVEKSSPEIQESSKDLNILATTPMLGEYVQKVAGDVLDVKILMPYSVNPHMFDPSPQDVKKLSEADLVFHVGIKYESTALRKLIENTVTNEQVLIEIGSRINPIEFKDEHDDHDDEGKHDDHDDEGKHDDHDDEGKHDDHDDKGKHDDHDGHDHGTFDPHFWFDIDRVVLAINEIKKELIKIDPENRSSYESSANSYIQELKTLDEEITSLIESIPSNNRSIVTTHESLGYLEIKYGINVLSTIIPSYTTEDGTTPKGLVHVIETIKENQIKAIFLESESPTKAAQVIADETEAIIVSGLWVETLKENQSYIDFMKTNIGIIVDNLQ